MSKGEAACKRGSLRWLEDTKAQLEGRLKALEDTQRDVNVRLEKLEDAVEKSLISVNRCIDSLVINLQEVENEEAGASSDLSCQVEEDAAFPVHLAAQDGNLAAVKALLLAGVDANTRNQRGETILQIAASGGYCEIVELLLRQCRDTEDGLSSAPTQEHLEEALMCAANSSVVRLLIGKIGRTAATAALRRAAHEGRLPVLCDLLHNGIDPNAVDANGWSALHFAAERGHAACIQALLDSSAKAGYVGGPKMNTPLHIAAEKGHALCVESLLSKARSTINVRDSNGWSALHYAAFNTWPECVELLLRHDVNFAFANNRGETALHFAACLTAAERDGKHDAADTLARRKQVLKFLLAAGADPNIQSKDARTAFDQDGAEALLQMTKEADSRQRQLKNGDNNE